MASIKHYGKRVAGYGVAILRRQVLHLRDFVRNRHPALFQALLKNQFAKRIYLGFVRPSSLVVQLRRYTKLAAEFLLMRSRGRLVKRDAASAKVLQQSLIRATARWQLGKRMDD